MIDGIIAFILSYALTMPFLIVVGFMCVIFEYKGSVLSAFITGATTIIVAYSLYEIPANYILYGALAYVPMGIIWSIWRWRVHCKKILCEFRLKENPSSYEKNRALEYVDVSYQIPKISSWVINWPWSVLANILGDVMIFVENLVSNHLKAVYVGISSGAHGEIEATENK